MSVGRFLLIPVEDLEVPKTVEMNAMTFSVKDKMLFKNHRDVSVVQ